MKWVKYIFFLLLFLISFISNYQGVRELEVVTWYILIILSPVVSIGINLFAFLLEINIDIYIWNDNSYAWWFIVFIGVTGFVTWFYCVPFLINRIKRNYNVHKSIQYKKK